jgi:hypothetical protein
MKIEIQTIWSPDLNPPSEGLPDDLEDFDLLMQVSLGEAGKPGGEVFSFSVSSPSALAKIEPNRFVGHTLVLDYFRWESIKYRLEKLFTHTESCASWIEVINRLAGYLKYSDE